MTGRWLSPPPLAGAFVALALAALTLGPYMRETDQAWLLDGGLAIANGHPEIAQAEFNFDKQFVSYYLPAIVFKFLPRPFTADQLVLVGNILGLILFWGALVWLLARSSRRLSLALLLPAILAPAFLVYSSFYASAFTSVSFVFLLAILLDRKKCGWPRQLGSFLLAFLAVGARADALFLLPLLAMLHSSRPTFVSVLRSPATWLMAAGGLTAFFLGRALYLDDVIDYAPHPFHLKVYLGNVAFGLGGAALLLLTALHATGLAVRASRCKLWVVFLWLGLALPMGYYSLQLLSPRHCTVGAVSILIFICAKRGRAIFQSYFQRTGLGVALKTALVLVALVPLLVGLNLTDVRHPKLTVTRPTLLPSGAGVAPAGAYLAFAASVGANGAFLDHNQAIWAAARATRFESDASGKVPYLFSPIESYLKFAIRLQDKQPERHSLAVGDRPAWFYAESRSLMRFQFTYPPEKVPMEAFLAHTAFAPATQQNWQGLTLFRGTTNATVAAADINAALWALNTAFGPGEFRLEKSTSLKKIPPAWAGKRIICASPGAIAFSFERWERLSPLASDVFGRWQIYELGPLYEGEEIPFLAAEPEKIFIGVSAFPAWMSLQKL